LLTGSTEEVVCRYNGVETFGEHFGLPQWVSVGVESHYNGLQSLTFFRHPITLEMMVQGAKGT